jgi:hypothetical protein
MIVFAQGDAPPGNLLVATSAPYRRSTSGPVQ